VKRQRLATHGPCGVGNANQPHGNPEPQTRYTALANCAIAELKPHTCSLVHSSSRRSATTTSSVAYRPVTTTRSQRQAAKGADSWAGDLCSHSFQPFVGATIDVFATLELALLTDITGCSFKATVKQSRFPEGERQP
jgi:hypothetical protein